MFNNTIKNIDINYKIDNFAPIKVLNLTNVGIGEKPSEVIPLFLLT